MIEVDASPTLPKAKRTTQLKWGAKAVAVVLIVCAGPRCQQKRPSIQSFDQSDRDWAMKLVFDRRRCETDDSAR